MKNIFTLSIMFILTVSLFVGQAEGQQKSKSELEKEEAYKKAIEEQKRAMADHKKAQKELEIQLEEQAFNLEDIMRDVNDNVESARKSGDAVRIFSSPRGSRYFNMGEPFVFTPGMDSHMLLSIGESESTTWDFTKSVKENSFSREYTFDVDKTSKSLIMSIRGDCKDGDIRIKIILPGGKNYSDIVIDEFGNLNWRKSFTISETENQDKTGLWKFKVDSNKASGYFKITLQTN